MSMIFNIIRKAGTLIGKRKTLNFIEGSNVTLTVASQKHIGVNFTSAELTMQLDDFAERVLKPRISQLASSIDADVANAYKSIGNTVGTPGTTPSTSLVLLQAQQKLNENASDCSMRRRRASESAEVAMTTAAT